MIWVILASSIISGAVVGFIAYKRGYEDGYKKGSYGTIDLC